MKQALVKAGTIRIETHWELKPDSEHPSYVRITQDGKLIAYEQFAPPTEKEK